MPFLRISTLLLFTAILFSNELARAEAPSSAAAAAAKCLGQLLVVSGLAGGPGLELGGDSTAVLAHLDEAGHSRYFAFSRLGYFTVEKPWPKRTVSFSVALPEGARHFVWQIQGGRVHSQSSGAGQQRADIMVDRFAPLDAQAWSLIRRIVQMKLPSTLALYQADRALAAKKHMHGGVPLGYVESYTYCGELVGDAGIASLVKTERARFDALQAKPVEFERYEVVRREDHPEWRRCETAQACTTASGPCGFTDVIARRARPAYESWASARAEQINCDAPDDDGKVRVACEAGVCSDPDATPRPAWTACVTDAECETFVACDEPMSVNRKTLRTPGFARWQWLNTVDRWDRCELATGKPPPKNLHARCAAGTCAPVK